jgi:hypothetical protein
MNCEQIQHCLLNCERPEQPPVEVRRHLARCADCRASQRRLVELEQRLPQLPVPPSAGREAFLARVRAGDLPAPAGSSVLSLWLRRDKPRKERGLRKLALAFSLAAALAVFALGWWAWPHNAGGPASPMSPLATRQKERDRLLAQARSPRERVEKLAALADSLQKEARLLVRPADGEQLRVVARFYREVVRENLLDHARQLTADERPAVLKKVADGLIGVESQVLGLLDGVPEDSRAPLQDIALASRESHDQLREILHGV